MFYKANSRQVVIDGNTMNYIEFGTGKKALVILPGLGDGLSPVHGKMQAIILALTYKQFARGFKVYIFSRKNRLERDCSTRSMAKQRDYKGLMIDTAEHSYSERYLKCQKRSLKTTKMSDATCGLHLEP